MKKVVNVGIVGFGTVGSGVCKALLSKRKFLEKRTGISIRLAKVCDIDLKRKRPVNVPRSLLTRNADSLIKNRRIDIVVELIGGIHPAREIIMKAMRCGKHVVTANKALLAECGRELFNAAGSNNVFLGFEASVGGGIPVIKALKEGLVANEINGFLGIVNGTTNFILTKMADEEVPFSAALKDAKAKGISEKNPQLDIEGIDSAHKLAILALLGFGISARPKDIATEGIGDIDVSDIQYGKKWGYALKLLAVGKKVDGRIQLRVHPTFIPASHILANVKGEDNAILIKGDLVGESLFYGKGAGSLPSSSAVVSDIVDIARNIDVYGRRLKTQQVYFSKKIKGVEKIEDLVARYYFRFLAIDKPGVLAAISTILSKNKISIANAYQIERKKGFPVPIVLITHDAREGNVKKALKKIDKLRFIAKKTVFIRIER